MDKKPRYLEVICGCMFSGKSEELLRRARFARIARLGVQIFTHVSDDHHGAGKGAHRIQVDPPLKVVGEASRIFDLTEASTNVVAVDGAHLFDWALAEVAEKLVSRGVRVIIAGLDLDFRGEPYGVMPLLMAQADYLTKLSAICTVCSDPASRTQRLINRLPASYSEKQVAVGVLETFEARCRLHHEVPGKTKMALDSRQVVVDVD